MNPRESNPDDQLSLCLRGEHAISQAVDAAHGFGTALRMAKEDLARLCVVVEELIANLYDHGGVTEHDEVRLVLGCDAKGIRISIVDPGIPFNSWSAASVGERSAGGGGAGVRLIQAWTELISYRSSGEDNQLELLLPFEQKR